MALVRRRRPGPRHLFVPYNAKIADITHADILKHTLTLANGAGTGAIAGETRTIVAIYLVQIIDAGTGFLHYYCNEGVDYITTGVNGEMVPIWVLLLARSQRVQYSLSVVNDDWDVYCVGYVVEA